MASYRRYKELLEEETGNDRTIRYDAETRQLQSSMNQRTRQRAPQQQQESEEESDEDDLDEQRKASRERMVRSYQDVMETYKQQQAKLGDKAAWVDLKTRGAKQPPDLYVTHINQTRDLHRAEGLEPQNTEQQNSCEWLRSHSIEYLKLTLKHLVDRGKIRRPETQKGGNHDNEKMRQKLEFDAVDINEFEYKLNVAIEEYTKRIKWLLTGSKRLFGLVKGSKVGILLDASDAHCNFGRLTPYVESIIHLLDEQMNPKKALYLAAFGSDVWSLWPNVMDINCRTIEQAKEWSAQLKPRGGCNLLYALKYMIKQKELDRILVVLGSVPDQNTDVLCDYIDQLTVGEGVTIDTVAYDCNNQQTNVTLRKLAEQSGGRYHCYSSTVEEHIYSGTDVNTLLKEIQKAQDIINKIKEMREGLLGTALVSIQSQISGEVSRLPPARLLPQPPGHTMHLTIEQPRFQASSSTEWLHKHGLKAKGLDLYQVLAPNAYSYREEFVPVIRKTVQSQVHERAMAQFKWHDGSMKNIHVDMTQLFEYQKQMGATVKLYEKRIDWLSSASRKIFGSVVEKNVLILVDVSSTSTNYLVHIQHSIRLLLEQQLANKEYFNIIAFGREIRPWKKTLVKPTPERLQEAWRWVLDLQCDGSRNFMGALRAAAENEEERQHNIEAEGIYLFTSGIPDQTHDVCSSYLEETCGGRNLCLHVVLFNVDDYDSDGAIPSRYANITKTAESLRALAHCTGGRFHWFRETGIIESDDISLISLEIEKALNFSKKAAILVESVKKKYGLDYSYEKDYELMASRAREIEDSATIRALPMPRHTALSQTRVGAEVLGSDEEVSRPAGWRPSSAKTYKEEQGVAKTKRVKSARSNRTISVELYDRLAGGKGRSGSARDPMKSVKKSSKKTQKAFFYTDSGNKRAGDYVGSVYDKFANTKSVRKGIKLTNIPEKEDQFTSKEWLRMYSLTKLKLDLNKLVSGPDCKHISKSVKALNKQAEAKHCHVFPTINVAGTLKHLQLLPHELQQYEESVERVLKRYLKRLQWLQSGSRRTFSTVVEKKVTILIDTSGSMDFSMEELKKDLASLVWDQIHKNCQKFNLIRFSRTCERWQSALVAPTEENCHDAVKWVSAFMANSNTCTLEALEMAFSDPDIEALYLLTDGKPDSSTSLVLREVARMNSERNVRVNTISYNCDDQTANNFLKMLAAETSGRYHRCHGNFDPEKFAHKLLTEGFDNPDHPQLPEFEGDDLHRLGLEISQARRYLHQSRSYRAMYDSLKTPRDTPHDCFTVGGGNKASGKSSN